MNQRQDSSLVLASAHRDLVSRRLPLFAAGWLAGALVWVATSAFESGATSRAGVVLLGVQTAILGAAIVRIRRETSVKRVIALLLVALITLGLSWIGFFVAHGGPAVAVGAIHAALGASAGLTFALPWHAELVLLVGTLWVSMLADPWLIQAIPPLQSAAATAMGTMIILLVAEGAHQSFRREVERRASEAEMRRQLEISRDAYRQGELKFRTLAESMEVALVIAQGTSFCYVNPAAIAMTGYSREELLGMPFWEVMHPDDREQVRTRGQARQLEAMAPAHFEYRIRTKNGLDRWVDLRAVTMEFEGQPAILGTAIDVTARKEAEAKLHTSLAELRASEDKLRQLALSQVSVREDERKRLGLDLHDDVCQELVGIGILLESVRQRFGPETAGGDDLKRGTRYLNEVVEHLRALASDLRPLQLQDLGLLGSLQALAQGMSSERMRIEISCPTPIPPLEEETELAVYRVAQEATLNASRHGAAHGIRMMLTAAEGHLRLEISDDGTGFDATATDGRGIGLVSMEERALSLGGKFGAWSEPGRGSTLLFECPLKIRRGAA